MRNIILIICALVFIPWPLTAAAEENLERTGITLRSLEFCRVELSEAGRRASFSGNAIYRSEVSKSGEIVKLTPVKIPDFMSIFIQLGQFESCIKSWRFQDPGEYTIVFSAGTRLEKWKISVATKGKALTVIMR